MERPTAPQLFLRKTLPHTITSFRIFPGGVSLLLSAGLFQPLTQTGLFLSTRSEHLLFIHLPDSVQSIALLW